MRSLMLLCAVALAAARPAVAGFPMPDPTNSQVPAFVVLVGSNGSSADPIGTFSVAVRSYQNTPIMNSVVSVSFTDCPYVALCTSQPDPNLQTDCTERAVKAVTDIHGIATFRIVGASSPAPCPSDPTGCAAIYADGIPLGNVSVATLDLDGLPGLSAGDLAAWLTGYFCGSGSPRLDYTGQGVDATDLSRWLSSYFGGQSTVGCPTACP